MRKLRKSFPKEMYQGKNNGMYGKSPSKESRQRQSKLMKGIPKSETHKKNMSLAQKGKKLSKEHKEKISETKKRMFSNGELINPMLGKKRPDFSKFCKERKGKSFEELYGKEKAEKMKERLRGIKISDETRKKMSLAGKGRKMSEENKRKLSERTKGKNNPMYGKRGSLSHMYGIRRFGKDNPFYGKNHSPENVEKMRKRIVTEDTKRKISESHKGKISPMKGLHHNKETIEKIKIARSKQILPVKDTTIEVKFQEFYQNFIWSILHTNI